MKKISMIYLSAISIALSGCVKGPIAELEEKGLKRQTAQERMDVFCNGEFDMDYSWGKATMTINDCNYVWTRVDNGDQYEGKLIESKGEKTCVLETKEKGVELNPPKELCNDEVTFKTGENEWTIFRNGEKSHTITKK